MQTEKTDDSERQVLLELDFESNVVTIMKSWSNHSIALFEYFDAI